MMYRFAGKFFILMLIISLAACNKRVESPTQTVLPDSSRIQVPAFGESSTFELATWNIEQFPKAQQQTVDDVKEIMRDLNIDLYAVEEITDQNAFNALLDSLQGYEGKLAVTSGFALWTGIIYRSSLIDVLWDTLLFEGDYDFPRPAQTLYLKAAKDGQVFDFTLIVLHLKAYGDVSSRERRRRAVVKLKGYIDARIAAGGDPDYIVVGDWNDQLNDPAAENIFQPFLDEPQNFRFLTQPFAANPTVNATYIRSGYSVIDHVLISADALTEYNGGVTRVLKIDQDFNAYESEVSDHRPVGVVFPIF